MIASIPNPIKNIILHYLNPHELYIKELRIKTLSISKSMKYYYPTGDCGYDGFRMIIRDDFLWKIGIRGSVLDYPKNIKIKELNKRANIRNKIFGITETNRYGMKNGLVLATNFCYINY